MQEKKSSMNKTEKKEKVRKTISFHHNCARQAINIGKKLKVQWLSLKKFKMINLIIRKIIQSIYQCNVHRERKNNESEILVY